MNPLSRLSRKKRLIVLGVLAGALLLLIIGAFFVYTRSKNIQSSPSGETTEEDIETLIRTVGSLIELPANEEPTVASVADVEKLADQPFFSKAQEGDRVLIYTQAKKAYLYRPSAHKLIEVSPVVIDPTATASAVKADEPISFVLRNGTTESGLTQRYIPELNAKISNAIVVARENAVSSDYEKTTVSPIRNATKQQAEELAKILGISYSEVPEDEPIPESGDYLIILGNDKSTLPELPQSAAQE